MKYKILYDFDDSDGYINRNCVDEFEGDWFELQDHIKQMRSNGCYNIDATAVDQN